MQDFLSQLRTRLQSNSWAADALALLAGGALVLAFAPFGWRWLAVLSPAVLMLLWLNASPRTAFRRGYLFGLAQFGLGVSWVYNSLHDFGQAPFWLAGGITLLFVLVLALFPALIGWAVMRQPARGEKWRLLLGFPAVWTLLEWVRSWLLTGFPWLLLGQSQVETPLAGFIPVLGELGATWLTVLTGGLLVTALVASGRGRWLALIGGVLIWIGGGLLAQTEWTRPSGPPLTASVVQGNVSQEQKWRAEQRKPTLDLYRRLTREHWRSDLIVWPETAVPMFYRQVEKDFLMPLAEEARRHDTELITGVFHLGEQGDAVYNAVVHPGKTPQFYYKRHLVPFGEYIPLRGWLQWADDLMRIPHSDIDAGERRPLLRLKAFSVGVSVCYEDAYGVEMLDALPEAALLVNISNDGWFGDSLAPHQHLEIARLRALETGRSLLRATNTGISAIIDHQGRITARAPQFEVQVLTAQVTPRQGLTPFARWGNWLLIPLLGVVLLAGVLVPLRGKQDNPPV